MRRRLCQRNGDKSSRNRPSAVAGGILGYVGSLSVAGRNRAVDAVTLSIWIQVHLGDPGPAGTANQAVNTQRKQALFDPAASGTAANNAIVTWASAPATETYAWVSLWDVAVGGTFLGSDDLATATLVTLGGSFALQAGDVILQVT